MTICRGNFINSLKVSSLLIILSIYQTAWAAPADQRVELGISALQQGDYETAKQWLESAQKQASTDNELKHALGLTYFHLNDLNLAEHYFLLAQTTPRRYEAAYFLGEIARKQGDSNSAKQWFLQAANQDEDIEVQAQADKALLKLSLFSLHGAENQNERKNSLRKFAFVSIETNFVDGVIDPDDTTGTNNNDTTIAFLAAGATSLSPENSALDWKLGGSLYTEKYSDLSIYNVDSYSVFSTLGKNLNNQKPEGKLGYTRLNLNGTPYLDQTEIALKNRLALGSNTQLILTGRYIDINSPDGNFNQYNGDTTELGAEIRQGQSLKWRLGVSWRAENRQGLATTVSNDSLESFSGFTAYSRDLLKLKGRLSWLWNKNWRQNITANLRFANYQDTDKFLASSSDIELSEQIRKSQRTGFKAELIRGITERLDLTLRYEWLNENSNNDVYDFTSQTGSAGISYLF